MGENRLLKRMETTFSSTWEEPRHRELWVLLRWGCCLLKGSSSLTMTRRNLMASSERGRWKSEESTMKRALKIEGAFAHLHHLGLWKHSEGANERVSLELKVQLRAII